MTERIKTNASNLLDEDKTTPQISNYFGPGNALDGKLLINGEAYFEGSECSGKITAVTEDGALFFGAGTKIQCDVRAHQVVLGGTMEGKIEAERVRITEDGDFSGNIITRRGLTIDDGARLNAKISMKKKRDK